jgi:hypothetical protein
MFTFVFFSNILVLQRTGWQFQAGIYELGTVFQPLIVMQQIS